ncbi:MAG: response regulator [Sulfurimonas sp.]|nr:response regulator [Sulfurimonas sp.]
MGLCCGLIKDTGKGISKKDLKYILEPFNSGNHADEKLGVGLSLCNGLVKLFESELNIKSEEGSGSSFNFVLKFNDSTGQAYKMMQKKKVRVLLLDKTKIDEANFLCAYLRSFGIDVIKSNILDEEIYKGIDSLYIIANQSDSSWMFKLGTLGKKTPVIMYLHEGEKLQTKLTHVIDEVMQAPLFPSELSKHLNFIHSVDLELTTKNKLIIKDEVRALLVEDNLINQRLMQIMLKGYNISVMTAVNGNEAIAMCVKNKFDIVFMDIDMPEKNGIVASKEIKEKVDLNANTPIVAFTAMAMQGDREKLLAEGLDDYLSKPIRKEKL